MSQSSYFKSLPDLATLGRELGGGNLKLGKPLEWRDRDGFGGQNMHNS